MRVICFERIPPMFKQTLPGSSCSRREFRQPHRATKLYLIGCPSRLTFESSFGMVSFYRSFPSRHFRETCTELVLRPSRISPKAKRFFPVSQTILSVPVSSIGKPLPPLVNFTKPLRLSLGEFLPSSQPSGMHGKSTGLPNHC